MVSSFRHSRNGHSKKTTSCTNSSCDGASQRNTADRPSQKIKDARPVCKLQLAKQRGRKKGSLTKLKLPVRGRKVLLKPLGDMQFEYLDRRGATYKYTSQLGVIIKREYPGLVLDKDQHGVVLRTRPAVDWVDYFLSKKDELGQTAGDRVLSEFWRLFEVNGEQEDEADLVLQTYLKKKVKDMMYQARVDAVKMYYKKKLDQKLDDKLARPIELKYEEYLEGKLKWCSTDVWPKLCRLWCSKDFLKKRKRGQTIRFSSDDVAQNHGGSRPFGETRQYLGEKFGPEFATVLNTYSVMKSGIQNMDENGQTGPMVSRKAQKIVNLYNYLGKDVPASLKSHLAALTANLPTSSSHVSDDDIEGEDMEEEDLDGEDMEREDLDGKGRNGVDIDKETEGEEWGGENIGSNNGGRTYSDCTW